ncbi:MULTISPECIES: hypothetical protein [Helcococcus]|uniref:Phage protein n=1 Tax=Helcococcus bovis TaxID=3153252 RepID=A0ABW9F8B9_9FIRM
MTTYKYITRDRECGNIIDGFNTLEEAKEAINQYEKEDKKDGIFESDFYEIYNSETEEIEE